MAPLFNKEPILNTINRISNTSDALRGTQFKTNTNEAAVQSYQDAARMSVGSKIDVIEDAVVILQEHGRTLCTELQYRRCCYFGREVSSSKMERDAY